MIKGLTKMQGKFIIVTDRQTDTISSTVSRLLFFGKLLSCFDTNEKYIEKTIQGYCTYHEIS